MSVPGTLGVGGALTVTGNALKNSAGNTIGLPTSSGTLALTSSIPVNNWVSLNPTNPSSATTLAYSVFASSPGTTVTVSGSTISVSAGTYFVEASLYCSSIPASTSYQVQIAPGGSSTSTGISRINYYNNQLSVQPGSGTTSMTITFSAASSLTVSISNITATSSITGQVYVRQLA